MTRWLSVLLAALLALASPALAATTPNSIVTAQTPSRGNAQFLPASSAGTYVTAYTAGANGSKIYGLYISHNDSTATHVITCGVFNGGTQYASYSVTTSTATAGLYTTQLMLASWTGLPLDSDANPYMILVSGDTLQCTFATSVTAAKAVNIHVIASDF